MLLRTNKTYSPRTFPHPLNLQSVHALSPKGTHRRSHQYGERQTPNDHPNKNKKRTQIIPTACNNALGKRLAYATRLQLVANLSDHRCTNKCTRLAPAASCKQYSLSCGSSPHLMMIARRKTIGLKATAVDHERLARTPEPTKMCGHGTF
jgi:hypothetical protein